MGILREGAAMKVFSVQGVLYRRKKSPELFSCTGCDRAGIKCAEMPHCGRGDGVLDRKEYIFKEVQVILHA